MVENTEIERIVDGEHAPHELDRVRLNEARNSFPGDDVFLDLAETFRVLGTESRLKILLALQTGEMCVCELSELLGIERSAISQQLRILRQTRLVKTRRDGRQHFYSLDDDHVLALLDQGLDHVLEERKTD
jgi:ArsR family transcriptional regulator